MAFKHSTMTLYSDQLEIDSHIARIALAEKGIAANIKYVDKSNPPESLTIVNPYNSLPTLVDRDLALYEVDIITEYLDERFPHPPLLPVYPVARAKCRLVIHRIRQDWLQLISRIENGYRKSEQEHLKKELKNQIIAVVQLFSEAPYFLSEEFTLADCYLAPIFWRLKSFEIIIPPEVKAIHEYIYRVFSRESFKNSLSEKELGILENFTKHAGPK